MIDIISFITALGTLLVVICTQCRKSKCTDVEIGGSESCVHIQRDVDSD